MKMTIIEISTLKNLYYANILYQLHLAEDKLHYFESKYEMEFERFEAGIKSSKEENFEQWDDYMEWKAFKKNYLDLSGQKKDIEDGNFKMA